MIHDSRVGFVIENCGGELNNFEETSTSKIGEILNQW